jgi:hypothetical protein
MPIRFLCPLGHPLIVPDELAGTEGRCPNCQQRVLIPVSDPASVDVEPVSATESAIRSADALAGPASFEAAPGPPAVGIGSLDDLSEFTEPATTTQAVNSAPVLPPPPPPANSPQTHKYVAPAGRLRLAYGVAATAGVLAFLTAAPAFGELQHPPAPGWVWILLLLSVVQFGYAFWLASLPDWSTVWIGMALYAILATLEAFGLAVAMATPTTRAIPLGLEQVRSSLGGWCALQLVLCAGLAYAAGWISARWRREYLEAKAAARR